MQNSCSEVYGYIYQITNNLNGKRYVGQTTARGEALEKYLGSGLNITAAVKKYGSSNFSKVLIDIARSKEELDEKEIIFIAWLEPEYNISRGGTGGNQGPECNARIAEALATKYALDADYRALKKKLGQERWLGVSRETRASYASKGWSKKTGDARAAIQRKAVANTDQLKKSESVKKVWENRSELEREKLRKKSGQRVFPSNIIITIVETGEQFNSISAVTRHLAVDYTCVSRALKNPLHTTKGFHLKWEEVSIS